MHMYVIILVGNSSTETSINKVDITDYTFKVEPKNFKS